MKGKWIFLSIGWAVQVIAYLWMPANPWSLVSGLLGIASVVLCAEGSLLTFFFGVGQILTYTYLCWLERFYAGIAINAFYFASQFYGLWHWRRRIAQGGDTASLASAAVPTKTLSWRMMAMIITLLGGASLLVGFLLERLTNDTQPYLDALTTVPAIVAQIMMVRAIREHWFLWFAIDILYIVMWMRAGDWCMTMQYSFWCMNCIYGYIRWTHNVQKA